MSSPLPLKPLEIYCHALSRRPPCRGGAASLWLSPCYRFQPGEGYLVVVEGQLSSRPCYRAEDRAASLPSFPLLQVPAAQAIRRCRKSRCRRCLVTSRRTELRRLRFDLITGSSRTSDTRQHLYRPLSPCHRFQQCRCEEERRRRSVQGGGVDYRR